MPHTIRIQNSRATAAIAVNAWVVWRTAARDERERLDLYNAMVISNLLSSPIGDNPRMYETVKKIFADEYTGRTTIFK